jgi:hypothetical protein
VAAFAANERPVSLGFVRPNGTSCLTARASYGGDAALLQLSQSDRLVWKLAFDGVQV